MAAVVLFGLIFGSFLNVVIYRLPQGLSLVRPGSHCTVCNKSIPFYYNIPILGYAVLRGKCVKCGVSFSWRYPLVEGLTALCLAGLYLVFGMTAQFVLYGILILFLIPIAFVDLDTGLILNKLTFPGFILGAALGLGLQVETWLSMLLGAVSGGAVIWLFSVLGKLIFRKESIGMGDLKLLVMIGVYVGFPDVLLCLFFGMAAGSVIILGGMILRKIKLGDTIPFGPFVAIGTLIFLLRGKLILDWYLSHFLH